MSEEFRLIKTICLNCGSEFSKTSVNQKYCNNCSDDLLNGRIQNPLRDRDHHLVKGSSEDMSMIPDNSIHLCLTSPPYNENKVYDQKRKNSDSLQWKDYIDLMNTIFSEIERVLVPGGRVAVNMANLGRYNIKKNNVYKPLRTLFEEIMLNLGLIQFAEIIWWKGAAANVNTSWGSWLSSRKPFVRDTHEYILVFMKEGEYPVPAGVKKQNIARNRFLELTKSVWKITAASNSKHPCVFPDQLAKNIIELYTFEGQTILDPFGGSGTTARVSKLLRRKSILFEISPKFQKLISLEISKTFMSDFFEKLPHPMLKAGEILCLGFDGCKNIIEKGETVMDYFCDDCYDIGVRYCEKCKSFEIDEGEMSCSECSSDMKHICETDEWICTNDGSVFDEAGPCPTTYEEQEDPAMDNYNPDEHYAELAEKQGWTMEQKANEEARRKHSCPNCINLQCVYSVGKNIFFRSDGKECICKICHEIKLKLWGLKN